MLALVCGRTRVTEAINSRAKAGSACSMCGMGAVFFFFLGGGGGGGGGGVWGGVFSVSSIFDLSIPFLLVFLVFFLPLSH